jgi:hypothetical protein
MQCVHCDSVGWYALALGPHDSTGKRKGTCCDRVTCALAACVLRGGREGQPGLNQLNLFVRVNASDRAAYEAFIAAQTGLPVEAVGIKSFGPPNPTEYVCAESRCPRDYASTLVACGARDLLHEQYIARSSCGPSLRNHLGPSIHARGRYLVNPYLEPEVDSLINLDYMPAMYVSVRVVPPGPCFKLLAALQLFSTLCVHASGPQGWIQCFT